MAERLRQSEAVGIGNRREMALVSNYASFFGESLLPPSDEGKRMTPDEFRQNYSVRYEIWNELSQNLTGQSADAALRTSDPETIEQLKVRLHILNQLDRYVSAHYSGDRGRVLRDRQMRAFEAIHEFLEIGNMEGFVRAPTGFGKTVMFGQVIAALDTTTTIVVPRRRLVEQTYESLRGFNPSLNVGRVYEAKKEYGRQITITTYDSLVLNSQNEDELRNRANTNLVIFDEVHRVVSENRINAGETFQNAIMLGFSATPVEVTDESVADRRIARMTRQQIHDIPYREAVTEGGLAPFSAYIVEVDKDISNVRITSAGTYDEKDLEEVLDEESANQATVSFFLEMRRLDIQTQGNAKRRRIEPFSTAVFAASVLHAQHLAQRFQEAGVRAAAVWGKQNKHEQNDIMRRFENGEIEVLCSKQLIREGTDIPRIRMVENTAPTTSPVEEQQRSGRGSRLYPAYPAKHLIVADFVYINRNRRGQQVTFPQVVGGARMERSNVSAAPYIPPGDTVDTSPDIHIEGLRVITNPEEVMTIVGQILEEKETNDEFTLSIDSFEGVFSGNYRKGHRLKRIADQVIEKFRRENPALFIQRRKNAEAIRNKDLFIQEMIKAGATLRNPIQNDYKINPEDFVLIDPSFDEEFKGTYRDVNSRLRKIADQVLEKLRRESSDMFINKRSGHQNVIVFIDRNLFIQEMLKAGAEPNTNRLQPMQPLDLILASKSFTGIFQGNFSVTKRLRIMRENVIRKLKTEHPELFAKRKTGNMPVEVITDRDLLIEEMLKAGAVLKTK